jgi:hypothetical protein
MRLNLNEESSAALMDEAKEEVELIYQAIA